VVDVVVFDRKYRKRVLEMEEEAENYDPLTETARILMRWRRASMQVEPTLEVL
jgi:hypothetical protein